jgi:uncharacterized protein (TIGR02246 family)
MKRIIVALSALILLAANAELRAGPIEEVTQIAGPRAQALLDGNVDGYVAAFADSAVFYSALTPFRIEGKEAIRGYFAALFQAYPKRRVTLRQPLMRTYNEGLVIQDAYVELNFTDQKGDTMVASLRLSVIWAKIGGEWQIVDQHGSRLPVPR